MLLLCDRRERNATGGVARGNDLRQDRERDLGRLTSAQIKADRAVQPRKLLVRHALVAQALASLVSAFCANRSRRRSGSRDSDASAMAGSSNFGSWVSTATESAAPRAI